MWGYMSVCTCVWTLHVSPQQPPPWFFEIGFLTGNWDRLMQLCWVLGFLLLPPPQDRLQSCAPTLGCWESNSGLRDCKQFTGWAMILALSLPCIKFDFISCLNIYNCLDKNIKIFLTTQKVVWGFKMRISVTLWINLRITSLQNLVFLCCFE